MFIRTALYAAAAAVALVGAPVSAATYDAYNFVHKKKPKKEHAIKLKKRLGDTSGALRGAVGKRKHKFGFEDDSGFSMGNFETTRDGAVLTGTIRNAAGQSFNVVMNFELTTDPGRYKMKAGASRSDWSYYTMTSGTMTSTSGEMANFDLIARGNNKKGRKFASQFGTGANVKNTDMMGLFSAFKAVQQDCDPAAGACQEFKGSLKLTFDEVYGSGAGGSTGDDGDDGRPTLNDDGGIASVPLPASAALLPIALGGLGLAGAFGRRRRES